MIGYRWADMNWYLKISQKADPRIDYEMETMVPRDVYYTDIGHDYREKNKVFLWFVDRSFSIHVKESAKEAGMMTGHAEWNEFRIFDDKKESIAQGRYDVASGRVSIGGNLEFIFKNTRAFDYAKERIKRLLYKTFGSSIEILDFIL